MIISMNQNVLVFISNKFCDPCLCFLPQFSCKLCATLKCFLAQELFHNINLLSHHIYFTWYSLKNIIEKISLIFQNKLYKLVHARLAFISLLCRKFRCHLHSKTKFFLRYGSFESLII